MVPEWSPTASPLAAMMTKVPWVSEVMVSWICGLIPCPVAMAPRYNVPVNDPVMVTTTSVETVLP